jgi:hypothetical protein
MLTELPLVENYYRAQAATAERVGREAVLIWQQRDRDIPFWDNWYLNLSPLTDTITEGQYEAATRAATFVPMALEIQGGSADTELRPAAFLTPTAALEYQAGAAPAAGARALATGSPLVESDALTAYLLKRFVKTMVEDAGREAAHGHMFAEPSVKYWYRKLQLPSCNRCAILVGRAYRKDADFRRHPQCDCQSVPAIDRDPTEEFEIVDAIERGDVTGFNKEEIDAIANGADPISITNSHRNKLEVADLYGRNVQMVTSGTTVRSEAGRRLTKIYGAEKVPDSRYRVARTPRLTVKEIYRQSSGPDELQRLMRRHGYIS